MGDGVSYSGSSYISLADGNTGNQPDTHPTDWDLLAQAGIQGAQGPQGSQGHQGETGATGPQGPAGSQGPQGQTGATGPQGPAGAAGTQGPQGPTGQTGAQGPQGPQGAAGASGPQGPQGPTGSQGPQGPMGPPGMNWKDAFAMLTTYSKGDGVSYNGSSYISLTDGNTGNQPDISPAFWGLLAQVGVQGAEGSQGPQGQTGATGPQGSAGPQGPQGATGATGPAGPAGATGATGAQGPQGPAGATGATGATGLQGPQGPAGATGATGSQGPAGPNNISTSTTTSISGLIKGASGNTAQAVTWTDYSAVDLGTLSSAGSGHGNTLTLTAAGGGIAQDNVCYVDSSGHLAQAKADASSTLPGVCIAPAAIGAGSSGPCQVNGIYKMGSNPSWTIGGLIYVSDATAGALTQTAPSTSNHYVQIVGVSIAADTILINPSYVLVGIK